MIEKAVMVLISLSIANFIYQVFTKKDWARATELSFFQGVALAVFVANN